MLGSMAAVRVATPKTVGNIPIAKLSNYFAQTQDFFSWADGCLLCSFYLDRNKMQSIFFTSKPFCNLVTNIPFVQSFDKMWSPYITVWMAW